MFMITSRRTSAARERLAAGVGPQDGKVMFAGWEFNFRYDI
jgi:hypothetical protein